MSKRPYRVEPEACLEPFDELENPTEPLTASEVADSVGIARRTAHSKLEALEDAGHLESKTLGDGLARVWFRRFDAVARADREHTDPAESRSAPVERSDDQRDESDTHEPPIGEDTDSVREIDSDHALEDVLDGWPAVSERKREQRHAAGRAALEYLRDVGEAKASDVKRDVEPEQPVDGQSPDTWWRKSGQEAFARARDAGLVDFHVGTKIWTWTGDETRGNRDE